MSVLTPTWPTLHQMISLASKEDRDMVIAFTQSNPHLGVMPMMKANRKTSHEFDVFNSATAVTYGGVNAGYAMGKANSTPISEQLGIAGVISPTSLQSLKFLTAEEGRRARYLNDLAMAEQAAITLASDFFYGTTVGSPEKFRGLAVRRSTLNATDVLGQVMTKGAGASGGTSIYFLELGFNTFHGLTIEGLPFGVNVESIPGVHTVQVGSSPDLYLPSYLSQIEFCVGLAEKNPRALRRLCNIAVTGSSNRATATLINEQIAFLPGKGTNAIMLMNATTHSYLLTANAEYAKYSGKADMGGVEFNLWQGRIPMMICDGITNTETVVS
jgi:hypothetical protein